MVRLVIVLLLSCIGFCARAEQHLDAYRVETVVANQSEAERINAAKATMGDVIVKVTGDIASLQHPLVSQAINGAPDYLQQFSYGSDRDKSDGVKLILTYSPQAIENLLRQAQLPVWPGDGVKSSQTLTIRIENIRDFTAYKQVQSYLKTITVIRRSELLSVNKDVLVFNIILDGDVTALKNALDIDKKLQMNESTVDGTQSNQVTLHWQN